MDTTGLYYLFSDGAVLCYAKPDAANVYFDVLIEEEKDEIESFFVSKGTGEPGTTYKCRSGFFTEGNSRNREIIVNYTKHTYSVEGMPDKEILYRISKIETYDYPKKINDKKD